MKDIHPVSKIIIFVVCLMAIIGSILVWHDHPGATVAGCACTAIFLYGIFGKDEP